MTDLDIFLHQSGRLPSGTAVVW